MGWPATMQLTLHSQTWGVNAQLLLRCAVKYLFTAQSKTTSLPGFHHLGLIHPPRQIRI
jgi:hypothetical protein